MTVDERADDPYEDPAYIAYLERMEAEYELEQKNGGRTRCPECDQFEVVHKTVCTYGYRGHPGADYSDYGKCRSCGHVVF